MFLFKSKPRPVPTNIRMYEFENTSTLLGSVEKSSEVNSQDIDDIELPARVKEEISKKVRAYSYELHNYFKDRGYPSVYTMQQYLNNYQITLEMQAKIGIAIRETYDKEMKLEPMTSTYRKGGSEEVELNFKPEYLEEVRQKGKEPIGRECVASDSDSSEEDFWVPIMNMHV
jgi:hypothetical protein